MAIGPWIGYILGSAPKARLARHRLTDPGGACAVMLFPAPAVTDDNTRALLCPMIALAGRQVRESTAEFRHACLCAQSLESSHKLRRLTELVATPVGSLKLA